MERSTGLLIVAAVVFVAGVALLFAATGDDGGVTTTTSIATSPGPSTSTTYIDSTDTTSSTTVETNPRFIESGCEFDRPPGYEVNCGWLLVPEDRSDPDNEKTVRLHVAIFRTIAEGAPDDPIVYLEGGPGGDALEAVPFTFTQAFAPFVENRDFIMFDQRGTGFAVPSLACDETTDLAYELLNEDLDIEEALAAEYEAFAECHQRLIEEADLSLYNSAVSAADVADLRVALGYDEWNLLGISYGTRLALTVMRDFPEGIRSVILDSVYPPQVSLPLEAGVNADRAFDVFFDACAADPECDGAFPDLRTRFFSLVDQLDVNPVTLTIIDVFTLDEYDALVDGDALLGLLFQSLYSSELIPILPRLIDDTENGDYQSMELLFSNFFANIEFISSGQTLAVQCREEVPFSDRDAVAASGDFDPYIQRFVEGGTNTGPFVYELCDLWDVGVADPIENEPVASEIPTLVLAGEFDPITPPEWGRIAASELTNSFFFEFPGLGHGTSVADDCALSITRQFLDEPTSEPDDSCIDGMAGPDFVTGDEPLDAINLVPVTVESFGVTINALVPDGWEELSTGIFVRGSDGLDQTALLFQAVRGSQADLLLGALTAQLGADPADVLNRTYASNAAVWDIYTFDIGGVSTEVAIAELDGFTVVVLLAADIDDRDAYIASILLPNLDAIGVE